MSKRKLPFYLQHVGTISLEGVRTPRSRLYARSMRVTRLTGKPHYLSGTWSFWFRAEPTEVSRSTPRTRRTGDPI